MLYLWNTMLEYSQQNSKEPYLSLNRNYLPHKHTAETATWSMPAQITSLQTYSEIFYIIKETLQFEKKRIKKNTVKEGFLWYSLFDID